MEQVFPSPRTALIIFLQRVFEQRVQVPPQLPAELVLQVTSFCCLLLYADDFGRDYKRPTEKSKYICPRQKASMQQNKSFFRVCVLCCFGMLSPLKARLHILDGVEVRNTYSLDIKMDDILYSFGKACAQQVQKLTHGCVHCTGCSGPHAGGAGSQCKCGGTAAAPQAAGRGIQAHQRPCGTAPGTHSFSCPQLFHTMDSWC